MDRVGEGDGFASGLIYGFLQGHDADKAVNYGAPWCPSMTTPGDTSMATLAEVERVAGAEEPGSFAKPIFYDEQFLEEFGLKDKTAVVIGGTGVLCGEIAQGLRRCNAWWEKSRQSDRALIRHRTSRGQWILPPLRGE